MHLGPVTTRNALQRTVGVVVLSAACLAPAVLLGQRAPGVDVWFDRGNEFDPGEPGNVMYSGDAGSYVAVLRVDADGGFSILSPSRPDGRSRLTGARSESAIPFQVDRAQGVGYVFAIASRTPFDFRNYRGRSGNWNPGTLGERGWADPFQIADRFARSTVGSRGTYSIAYAPYEVGRGGAGRAAYRQGVRYDDAYGGYAGGYQDPWGASPYRQGYDDFYYGGGYNRGGYRGGVSDNRGYGRGYGVDSRYSSDPRTRALRHCPDGTLAPYTTRCAAFARPGRAPGMRPQPPSPVPWLPNPPAIQPARRRPGHDGPSAS